MAATATRPGVGDPQRTDPRLIDRRPTVALVADDFGQYAGIDAAVLQLADRGRLQGTSCLSTSPRWRSAAPALAERFGRVSAPSPVSAPTSTARSPSGFQVGLHFNLSDGEPLSADLQRIWPRFPGIGSLLARAAVGALPVAAIAAEWQAQLDAFTAALGRAPDHVDGHQHVHHLRGVRETILAAVARLSPRPWLRNTGRLAGPGSALKQRVIEWSGGRWLQRELDARGWPRHTVLLGAYDFRAEDVRPSMQAWWREAVQGGDAGALLFCHPATTADPADPIGAARPREWAYLSSDALDNDLAAAGIRLGLGLELAASGAPDAAGPVR